MEQIYTSGQLARIGVLGVGRIITEKLGWIFREQTVEDYGIDAHIEVCLEGEATGRLIAAQIKCGDSWFSRRNGAGYLYTGSVRHLDYWLSYSLPVILIFYDWRTSKAVWTPMEKSRVTLHNKTWSITVPAEQMLNERAEEQLRWLALLGGRSSLRQVPPLCNGHGAGRVLGIVAAARERVYVAAPWIDAGFLSSLKLLSHQGVETCLLLNRCQSGTLRREIELARRESPALQVRTYPGLHEKLMVVDDQRALLSSANLTAIAWRSPVEQSLEFSELHQVERAEQQFQRLWQGAVPV